MSALCLPGGEVAGCSCVQVVPFQVQVSPRQPPPVKGRRLPPNSSNCPVAGPPASASGSTATAAATSAGPEMRDAVSPPFPLTVLMII
jgi:hypothetical protein